MKYNQIIYIRNCQYCELEFEALGNRKYCEICRYNRICLVSGCDEIVRNKDGVCCAKYCGAHEARKLKGDPDWDGPVKKIVRPRGTGTITPDGYIKIGINGIKILEHRYIIEQILGRPLEAWENVHHINGVKDDNRLDNLELWVTMQPTGQRVEDLIEWAENILTLYKPYSGLLTK